MNDHQQITAERGRRAADLRAAAVALLEQQSIAAGVMLDLDSDQVVAAGPKAAILCLLSNGAPAATSGDAPADLQQLKALALAATPGPWVAGEPIPGAPRFLVADCGPVGKVYPADQKPSHGTTSMDDAKFIAAANPAIVLGLIARIEHEREVAASWQRTAEKKDRDWNEARMAFENYKCAQRAAAPATASGDELPPPFFYYRANKDGSVEWGEDCCCRDDVYTKEATAEEYETHGGKVYSESQVRALLATKPTADLYLRARVADLVHLLEFATITTPSKGDAEQAKMALRDVQSLLATKPAAAPAVPEKWLNFVRNLSNLQPEVYTSHGLLTVTRAFCNTAADLLAATPAASTTGAAQTAEQALKFADDVITCAFDGGDLDGATIQEIAEARGLIRKTTQPEPCGEVCNCMEMGADFPAECFQKTYVSALRPTPTHSSEAGDA